mmetsp:Transcript_24619/g.41900  ORF Transcript_24619/g.41900 Transcript_24619/m.41900 type:complete len:91 (-) Transcript_24619:84-356(-)
MRSKKYTSRISIARKEYLRRSAVLIFFLVVLVGVVIGDLRGVMRRLLVEDLVRWDDGEGVSIFCILVFVEELCVAVMRLIMILWEDEWQR